MASGRTSTLQQQSAAPQGDGQRRADQSEKGQRRRAGEQRQRHGQGRGPSTLRNSANSGVAIASGRPVVSQCASAFGRHGQFQRHGRHHQQIERSVVPVGRQQPVEREQAGEQRADPQHRRADALEQRKSGPTANGVSVTTIRKKRTAIDAPPPARNAMRMSRMKRAVSAFMPRSDPQFAQCCRWRWRHGSRRRSFRPWRDARASEP